ncbi:MAG: hypothetical protein A3J94_02975 [Syntrophus sp. RIFOXYC2_FULL_54_9]|nr:MAG: hypothetical protein A3J94_02975 [Syntrophus sp. RIFOXYC2_FULL_54_9]
MKRGLRKLYKLYVAVHWIIVFRVRHPFRFIRSYFFLDRSILFDRHFYLEKNIDVQDRKMDPLAHYLTIGNRSSNPNRIFDTVYYIRQIPDNIKTGINPLIHYIDHGAQNGLKPNPLFDTAYYLSENPDVIETGVNPLAHYMTIGHRSSNPSPLFDTAYYLRQYPDVDQTGLHPLAHYLEFGACEYRNPNPLFDSVYYRNRYGGLLETGLNPLLHYLERCAHEDLNPHPLFHTAYYLRQYPDVVAAGMNPLAHYLKSGASEDRKPNPLFDPSYYRQVYGDMLDAGMNLLFHYLEHGALENLNPNPLFDTAYYLKQYPDIVESGLNPLVHYLEHGALDRSKPNPLFDSAYYLEMNPGIVKSGMNPLVHYLMLGVSEGRKPNPLFDTKYYLEKNPDVEASLTNPLVHYLEKGAAEGRDPGPDFDTAYYLEMSPDVAQEGCNPLVHYLEIGIRESRYPNNVYELWVRENRLTDEKRRRILEHIRSFACRPTFSLIVPVFNTDERWLRRCLDSVTSQLYPDWELCIADDASTDPTVRAVLEEYRAKDSRIRVVFRRENGHISAASNSALEMATGEFVALLDHDDEIAEDALYENAALLNEHPDEDMIYSDEDKMNEEGERQSPFFKPDWSPDTFLSHMYTCHLGVYRTTLVRDIGGFRVGFEGSQDYDMVLRLTEKTEKIYHIPKVLYHWRTIHGSTALTHYSKNYAYKAGLKAIQGALDRRGEGGWVEHVVNYPGQYMVHFPVIGSPLISIVIPTKDHPRMLDQCLKSIFEKTSYLPFEVIVVDNGSVRTETHDLFASWKNRQPDRLSVVRSDIPFNFSRLINEGVRRSQGALVVLLNDDVEVLSARWLEEMAGQAQRQSIGAVGAFLLYPDRTIQHAGLILGVVGPANHAHRYAREDSHGYHGRLIVVGNYAAVTGACLMVKKQLFTEAGGLDEDLAVAYNDVDFCLRLLKRGCRNVVLPQVRLIHHESGSRGSDRTGQNRVRLGHEVGIMNKRWAAMIQNDPYYNPNLTRDREDFTLGFFSVKR